MDKKVGHYSFIIGVIIAVVLGLAEQMLGTATEWLVSIMVILGLIVGFMNVSGKESRDFLIVAVILVLVSGGASGTLGNVLYVGSYLVSVFNQIMAFVVPATIVVGLKNIKALAEKP